MVNYGLRHGTTQTISVASSSAAVSNAFGDGTHYVRVVSTTNCHITFAGSPTATTSMAYLPAGEVEVIKVSPGEKMAAIRNSADGTLYCTELSA
jgi:hypothetical protein